MNFHHYILNINCGAVGQAQAFHSIARKPMSGCQLLGALSNVRLVKMAHHELLQCIGSAWRRPAALAANFLVHAAADVVQGLPSETFQMVGWYLIWM